MTPSLPLNRRAFLLHLGRGSVAVAVLGVAGCGPSGSASRPAGSPAAAATSASTEPSSTAASGSSADASGPASNGFDWERVNLGTVSAYVLVRDAEAAVVDTGFSGNAADIEVALGTLGLGWDAVGHVIVTHGHLDHAGGVAAVLELAPDATGYAGAADIPVIKVPRPLTAVGDGDLVFDLRIVTTPGHTAGHISVLDEIGGILVAGDALGTTGGRVTGSKPQFTADLAAADQSVAKLGALRFETLLVGHGDPITSGASTLVASLAAS